ncbi:hypothetical protein ACSBQY_02365 [Micrococcus lylae]|uniref:Uncharacterized protein n=1 Tax=Micrococcus lylae TaxID=1273 RepID=A0ABY2JZ90_9MICC|nr:MULTISPECIES: hypothetical protein [Micrococcus]TFH99106.1 hypothetical protein E4A49_06770 [Micrococcus lylae]
MGKKQFSLFTRLLAVPGPDGQGALVFAVQCHRFTRAASPLHGTDADSLRTAGGHSERTPP